MSVLDDYTLERYPALIIDDQGNRAKFRNVVARHPGGVEMLIGHYSIRIPNGIKIRLQESSEPVYWLVGKLTFIIKTWEQYEQAQLVKSGAR